MNNPLDLLNAASFPDQDYIILAGEKSPGLATPAKAGSPRKWDKRDGYGLSGATLVYIGDDLAVFDVIIDLWTTEQFGEWARFAKLLEKAPAGTRPKAMGIQHPLLNRSPLKITEVVVFDVSQFEQDDYGLYTCSITFSCYRAPKPVLGKPLAAIPAASKPVPTAKDAADVEIQKLMGELKGLL